MKTHGARLLYSLVTLRRRLLTLLPVYITIFLISCSTQSNEKINDPGFQYYHIWKNSKAIDTPAFWTFQSASLSESDINNFNQWHKQAKFKDISPRIDDAYFFKSPWPHEVVINTNGNMVFQRTAEQNEAHSMIEISVNNQTESGRFINYGGYRSMSTGVPYVIELEVMLESGNWIESIPWMLVFQGHAIPSIFNRSQKFNPPFALLITRGRWEVHIRADSRLSLPADKSYERFDKVDLGKATPNVWTRFKIKVMWGHDDFPEGNGTALGIWRDGKLYHEEWGIKNFYNSISLSNEALGPYLMIGAYTPAFDKNHDPITIKFKQFILKKL